MKYPIEVALLAYVRSNMISQYIIKLYDMQYVPRGVRCPSQLPCGTYGTVHGVVIAARVTAPAARFIVFSGAYSQMDVQRKGAICSIVFCDATSTYLQVYLPQ